MDINEKIQRAYQETVLERKFDLGSGHMGNGITVWNRAKEVHGDYEKVAHVDRNRKITYYIKNPPKQVKDYVEKIAKGKNPNISATQSGKVFKEEKVDEMNLMFGGYHLKDNILDEITVEELQEMAHSNLRVKDARSIQKEFDTLLKMKIADAKAIARKVIPALAKDFEKHGE